MNITMRMRVEWDSRMARSSAPSAGPSSDISPSPPGAAQKKAVRRSSRPTRWKNHAPAAAPSTVNAIMPAKTPPQVASLSSTSGANAAPSMTPSTTIQTRRTSFGM